MKSLKKQTVIGLLILVLLTPAGVILPRLFHSGEAWGEWPSAKVKKEIGYIPSGMKKNSGIWKAPVIDYSIGKENDSLISVSVYYILSGFIGIGIISLLTWAMIKIYNKNA
jgi:hypothetical protein